MLGKVIPLFTCVIIFSEILLAISHHEIVLAENFTSVA